MSSINLKEVLGDRLRHARHTLAMTQKEWCEASGMKLPSLRDYELCNRTPGGEALSLYARAGINLNWLLTGEGPVQINDLPKDDGRVYVDFSDFTMRQNEADNGSADTHSPMASLALSRQWLDARGLRDGSLIFVRAPDASMSPTVRPGWLVVVDVSVDKIRGDGIYCLRVDGDPSIKRLQLDFSGGAWVRNDNQAYKDQHVDSLDKLPLIGKAILTCGELQD